ncbi:hypothetical protein GOP47_0008191 [Adiantum capillus-veneris]|uniref:glucan endo-1,3-beta-D-glucosidase n=1 Tax=Adiantum capillus-veneris TaxID=13818 RepID=A0A9D4UXZ4_ADICA|nr:hypothetical protein GOP47_0008191 [Adiantum capillus-veneris]
MASSLKLPPGHGVLALGFIMLIRSLLVSGATVGFNYGTQMSVVPSASQVVRLVKVQHMNSIRLYDANSSILKALGGTEVEVSVGIPNTQLLSIGQSKASAAKWVQSNVLPFLPNTNITSIVIGEEVFTALPNAALVLLPALNYLYSALLANNLHNQVRLSTSLSTSIILDSFPPSQAFFNKSLNNLMLPMLSFLSQTGSYVMLNVDTYSIYKASKGVISLEYALFKPLSPGVEAVDSNTLLTYTNLFDAVLDSAFYALARLNFSKLPVVVSATGWPYQGDSTLDADATMENAATYNSNLIARVVNNTGTPKHPRLPINTFILELFSEDLKAGPAFTRHYGLFNASTLLPTYLLRLTGSGQLLSNDTTNGLFCVAKPGADDDTLQIALDWACGIGQANCSAIQPGMLCYEPDTVSNHASYAFDAYYQANGASPDSCTFDGAAVVTTTNPSYGACLFPGSMWNSTSLGAGNVTLSRNTSFSGASNSTTVDGSSNHNSNGACFECMPQHWSGRALLIFGLIVSWLA